MTRLILIPARNEALNLSLVIGEVRRLRPQDEILVVDDASEDHTEDILRDLGARWLRLPTHLGLGGAMRAGLRYARLRGYDTVVRLDGDAQHRPDQIDFVVAPIESGAADAVQGSRYSGTVGYASAGMRRLGQRALGALLSLFVGRRVSDPTSGFWAFGPRALRMLADHHPTGYPEPELLLFLARNRLRVTEVPVQMRGRLSGRSSLTLPRAGLAFGRVLLAMVVVPIRAGVGTSAHD